MYDRKNNNPMTGRPCIEDNRLYIGRSMDPGYVYCVDTGTGEILWKNKRYPDRSEANVNISITYADGKLYYGWIGWSVEPAGGHRSYPSFSCI